MKTQYIIKEHHVSIYSMDFYLSRWLFICALSTFVQCGSTSPVQLIQLANIPVCCFKIQVVCGSFHSCIVTKDGDVYTWGRNTDGQLGNGTRQDGVYLFSYI